MFWEFCFACLAVLVGILLWCGIVNQIEHRRNHVRAMKRLELKAAKQTHEQWMEERTQNELGTPDS